MPNLLERTLSASVYGAATMAKVGWYTGHYLATRRLAGPMSAPGQVPKKFNSAAPSRGAIQRSFAQLLATEANDIARGAYALPREFRAPTRLLNRITQSPRLLKEADAVTRRSHRRGGATEARDLNTEGLPSYFAQNFHFQTDGWLSDYSASIYDDQVETIFTGAASAMRRRVLPPVLDAYRRAMAKGDECQLVDIGCGTGAVLEDIADNAPKLSINALDLSRPYLNQARSRLARFPQILFAHGNAEELPIESGTADMVMSVFLFHELPPNVRATVAGEISRILKPGGLYIHADSIQYGDTEFDALLEGFPRAVHEPYYDSYAKQDLSALFGGASLAYKQQEIGFLTKVSVFQRMPETAA